jgi:predicted Fe-Mo cluster-binding NifX family protein
MKLAIPTNNGKNIAEHFGRCEFYAILNEKGEDLGQIENTSEHMGGTGLPPELMKEHQINILLCRDIGPKALDLCQRLKIEVFTDQAETIEEIFLAWKNNRIKKPNKNNSCKQHSL